ncbi:DUF5134 domain-containing protein [Streptomyces sp. RPT161]|uniref:DUF5134 domain-containing protein n=1 Tax=Streptomyces sp. RPT161 TaxID=3015993 RepID=UPI0022B86DBC|nr:DUF5134 domain-containing protein [Streptomyces sp. RPT161]
MIAAHGLRWTLTLLFAAVTAYSAARTLRPGRAHGGSTVAERVTHSVHALMGLAMIAMVWPWGMRLPTTPQVVVFSLASAWFVASALLHGRWVWGSDGDGHPRLHGVPHAVMMGAMAWMLAVMPGATHRSHGSGGSSGSMADMPGMDMPGSGGNAMPMSLHGVARPIAVALLVVFVVMALWWLSRAFDTASAPESAAAAPGAVPDGAQVPRAALDAGCHGAMALGMAVMLLVMA